MKKIKKLYAAHRIYFFNYMCFLVVTNAPYLYEMVIKGKTG